MSIISLIEGALKDMILYDAPTQAKFDTNLLTIKVNDIVFQFDFMNGKIEEVYINGIKIPLSVSEKYNLTLLIMS